MSATASKRYDLVPQGEPIIDVKNVPFSDDGKLLTLGKHGFTLGWPYAVAAGVHDLSLRCASLGLAAGDHALVAAVVQAASRSGKTGCAAVEDLVCSVSIGSAACAIAGGRARAPSTRWPRRSAPFAPASGIDLTLAGSATPSTPTAILSSTS